MRRLYPSPLLSALLMLLWVMLAGELTPGVLAMAVLLGTTLPLLTARWWPDRPRPHPLRLMAYLALVLWDVILASIAVARILLFLPQDRIRPAWVVVPIDLPCAEARALLAGTITLTPGTLTADFSEDGKVLLVHALHAPDTKAVREEIRTRYEARLKRIFT